MKRFVPLVLFLTIVTSQSRAQFVGGNLAVLRVGTGAESLVNNGNSLFIDQFTPTGGLVNSVTIPNTWPAGLILSGVAGSEGGLTRSLDHSVLILTGYNTNRASTSGSLSASTGAQVARGYATVDATGGYVLRQARSDIFSANNPRCAAGDGTNSFWLAGGATGTLFLQPPAGAPVTLQSAVTSTRFVKAVNGNVYFNSQSGTAALYVLPGLPAVPEAAVTVLATGAASAPVAFDVKPDGSVIYIADQRTTATGGGIQKWINPGSGWTNVYTLTNNLGAAGAFGLVVDFSAPVPILYATSGDASTNRLVSFVDTNSAATGTIIARAGANQVFKALDFAPDLRPLIAVQPQSKNPVAGTDVALTVTATGSGTLTYQWQKNSTNLALATASALNLHAVTTADSAPYRVIVANGFGSVTSSVAVLTVVNTGTAPVFTLLPQPVTNYVGGTAVFTGAASGTDPLAYQWQYNDANLSGQTNSTLTLTNVAVAQSGNYRLRVSNSVGVTNSPEAYLLVRPVPPQITLEPVSATILAGGSTVYSVAVTGTPPITYQWTHNNVPLTDVGEFQGTATDTLTLTGAKVADAGIYYVIITNSGGTTNSQPANLTVYPAVPPSAIAYTNPGAVYRQDFNSLPNPGTVSVNSANPVTIGADTFGLYDPFDFAAPVITAVNLGGLGLSNMLSGWFGLGTTAVKFGASAGDQSTGGIISFGPTNSAATNRALGLLATSSTGGTAFGARFVNAGSNTFTSITLHFTGELWRQQPTAKTLAFGYLLDSAATNSFTTNVTAWVTNLDVSFPTNAFAILDGTVATNQTSLGVTNLTIPAWTPGAALWLVWQMTDAAGTAQGLAIDDLTFSAQAPAHVPVSLAIRLANPNVILSWPTAATGYTLQQKSSLAPIAPWQTVPQSVVPVAGQNTVTVPLGQTPQFFRLSQ